MLDPTPPQDFGLLLERARSGDAIARSALLERCQGRLLARIRLMLGPEARRQAESVDFLQGVFVALLERLGTAEFTDEAQALRWMTAVARNAVRDHASKHRARAFESLTQSLDSNELLDSQTPSPASEADRVESQVRLVEQIEQLPDDERAVLELHSLDGLSFGAIGARMGWSDDRARLLHVRALARLGQRLGGSGA